MKAKKEISLDQKALCSRSNWTSLRRGRLLLGFAIGLSLLLLVPFLGSVPGLHGDEAWAGGRAYEIAHGYRPMIGMNSYTGPEQQYLLSIFLKVFGYSVTAIRSLTVISFLASVFLYFYVIKHLFNEIIAGISVVLLVTMPWFTIYGRAAHEIFTLNPILSLLAILLLLEAREETSNRHYVFCFLSGICLGLGIWNHLIFMPVPAAIFLAAVMRNPSVLGKLSLYVTGYGIFLALMPRLYYEAVNSPSGGVAGMNPDLIGGIIQRLSEWPGLWLQMAQGDSVFNKYAGEVRFHCPNLTGILLLAGFAAHLKNRGLKWSPSGWLVIFYGLILFVSTATLCQRNVDQYFLLLLYVVPVGLACSLKDMIECGIPRFLVSSILVVFMVLQISRTGANYFLSELKSGGRVYDFQFGSNWLTSNNSIRTDELYNKLVKLGAKRIYAEYFIAMPLRFYDQTSHFFEDVNIAEGGSFSFPSSSDIYAVVYVGGIRRAMESDYSEFSIVSKDEHFCILRASLP